MSETADLAIATSRIQILDITPVPPEDQMVAIALALDQAWPEPQPPQRHGPVIDSRWRFASRPWLGPAIPVRRWGSS